MNKTLLSLGIALTCFASVGVAGDSRTPQLGTFGIELSNRDLAARPGDDFARYANGHWFDTYQLKDYETRYGSFNTLADRAELQTREIIEGLQARRDLAPGSDEQKIRDFYASYMDTAARDAADIAPLRPVLDRIAAIDSYAALTEAFGRSDIVAYAVMLVLTLVVRMLGRRRRA